MVGSGDRRPSRNHERQTAHTGRQLVIHGLRLLASHQMGSGGQPLEKRPPSILPDGLPTLIILLLSEDDEIGRRICGLYGQAHSTGDNHVVRTMNGGSFI